MIIYNNQTDDYYTPVLEGEITWESRLFGAPGKLECTVVKGDGIDFRNGNTFVLMVNGKRVFKGYAFSKDRNKNPLIDCVVYDQLRYFKNKTTMKYSDVTASELFVLCAKDMTLNVGEVDSSATKLQNRVEEDKEYFEIINTGVQREKASTGEIYVMYDDAGKLCFKNFKNMAVLDRVYDASQMVDFKYTASIDEGTYNVIRIDQVNEEANTVTSIIRQDEQRVKDWGVLQFYAQSSEPLSVIESKIDTLLPLLSREIRSLSLENVLGDIRVRAGCIIPVSLNLGDMELVSAMLVTECKHKIQGNRHTMDLTVENKTFMPAIDTSGIFKVESRDSKKGSKGSSGGKVPEDSVEGEMWNILRGELGYSKEAAAVVIAHAKHESGFNVSAVESGNTGEGRGLFQWGVNARWQDFLRWANEKGLDPYTVKTQTLFVDHEMKSNPAIMASVGGYDAFKENTSIDDANRMFYFGYERPLYNPANYESRKQASQDYFNQYSALEAQYGKGMGSFIFPVTGHSLSNLTSDYGWRQLVGYNPEFHLGIDIGAGTGTQLVAADGGTIELSGNTGHWSYGNQVLINHGNGLKTRYAHMDWVDVEVGQSVSRGQQIGAVGTTGSSTGPHLHFEVIKDGQTVDPKSYL